MSVYKLAHYENSFLHIGVRPFAIQCSLFITLLIITQIGYNTVMLWLPYFFNMELYKGVRKMTMKWSFSYNSFVKSLYNTIRLLHGAFLWTNNLARLYMFAQSSTSGLEV